MCYYRKMLCRDVGHFSQMKFWFLDSFRFTEKLRRYYQAFILVYLAGSFSCYWHLIFIWYICYSSCTTTETLSVKVHLYLYVYFNVFIFNWRIIALQYCLGFCHTSTWIHHRYTYVPSLLTLSPTSHPFPPPLSCYRAPVWVPWVIWQIPIGYFFLIFFYL